ncbi:MAG: hypothetical protein HY897_08210 [Deltaproteobacteria bacterium]|nr:hypothetical protein [Deltaproteobacteria bacterium]
MLHVDLYFKRIDISRHLPRPGPECRDCDAAGCRSFVQRFDSGRLAEEARSGTLTAEGCPLLTANRLDAFRIALAPDVLLPMIELSQLPRPVEPGRVTTGNAAPNTPILVTANNEGTVTLMTALLSLSSATFRLAVVDTRGDSVDMAMILGSLTAGKVIKALETPELRNSKTPEPPLRPVVLPGFAAPLAPEIAARSRWRPVPGPLCAAELPLFLGDLWHSA